ncbi:MAG TPA: hypothetical protein VGC10_06580 [Sphingomonas sp.]
MTDFVRVHGAWHGGWCRARVRDSLAADTPVRRRVEIACGHDVMLDAPMALAEIPLARSPRR